MLKTLLPSSLFGRFLLIILLPNILVQMVSVYVFYERHWSGVSKHMAAGLAGDVAMLVEGLHRELPAEREQFLKLARQTLYLDIAFTPGEGFLSSPLPIPDDLQLLAQELNARITAPYLLYYSNDDDSLVLLDIKTAEGLLHVLASKKRIANPSTYIFLMWMTGAALLFLTISILFMRNQVRAISNLAIVAEKFGKGQDTEDFKPHGAREVRQVGHAFLHMKNRIQRQVEQRTEMLAGVSHDLKTPLTRMKLQLALLDSTEEIRALEEDISEMQKMVQGYLDFAQGKERVIDASVDVSELIKSVVAGYRHQPKPIEVNLQPGILMHCNANAMRRVVTNIMDNALRHGDKVSVTATSSAKNLLLTIEDNGPSIPAHKREDVFKPFFRLDESRHLEGGNTGLGLTIAKDIIVGYGGHITLEDSSLGGLKVMIKLPL